MVRPPRNPQPVKGKRHCRWAWRQGRGPSLEEGEEERSRVMNELMETFKVGDKHQSVISTTPHHTLVTKDSESLSPYKKAGKDEAEKSLQQSTFKSENNKWKTMERKLPECWGADIGLNISGSSECVGEKQELGSGSVVSLTDRGKLFYHFMEMKQPPMTAVTSRDSFERNEAMLISNIELLMKEREKVWEEIQEMKNKLSILLEVHKLSDEKNETQQQWSRERGQH